MNAGFKNSLRGFKMPVIRRRHAGETQILFQHLLDSIIAAETAKRRKACSGLSEILLGSMPSLGSDGHQRHIHITELPVEKSSRMDPKALNPVRMARAFGLGIRAGRLAYEAGVMAKQDMAVASTPVAGYPILL